MSRSRMVASFERWFEQLPRPDLFRDPVIADYLRSAYYVAWHRSREPARRELAAKSRKRGKS